MRDILGSDSNAKLTSVAQRKNRSQTQQTQEAVREKGERGASPEYPTTQLYLTTMKKSSVICMFIVPICLFAAVIVKGIAALVLCIAAAISATAAYIITKRSKS